MPPPHSRMQRTITLIASHNRTGLGVQFGLGIALAGRFKVKIGELFVCLLIGLAGLVALDRHAGVDGGKDANPDSLTQYTEPLNQEDDGDLI